jgi:1-acyl-sn-glycerol-3-phosphate acyltransferase
MRSSPKRLDFVSIAEVFAKPFVGWFFGNMNAFALDRGRRDSATVRIILDRLARGRSVAMFPEGHIRKPEQSVVRGAPFRGGVARIARLAGAPILPVVAWGTPAYSRFTAWLPHRRTRYGINYGEPIFVRDEADEPAAQQALAAAYPRLFAELMEAAPDLDDTHARQTDSKTVPPRVTA